MDPLQDRLSTPSPWAQARRLLHVPRPDVVAGLCVAGLLLPEAVAYAGLAHVPVTQAFMAALIGLLLYALAGSSRFAIVSGTSSTATLVAAAALSVVGSGSYDSPGYLQAVLALVLLSGVMLFLLGSAGQGQLSSFISRPVLKGFAFALAVTIVIKQLPDALGLVEPLGSAADPLHMVLSAAAQAGHWHGPSMVVALAAGLLIIVLRHRPQVPASLLAIALAIGASHVLDFPALGVAQIGTVAPLAFHWGLPMLDGAQWARAGELAFGLVMLVFAESWGSMRSTALAHHERVDANRELLVLGACNAVAAMLHGMPVGAGFSATSANAAAGAVSRRSGAVALLAIIAVLSLALNEVQRLPRPVLAVAVISALWHALSPTPLLAQWRMNRDRVLLVGAALAVMVLGVLDGMLAAVGLSVVVALNRFSQPVVHELGVLPGTRNFVDIRTQANAQTLAGVLIVRPEEPLFFASAERVTAEILQRFQLRGPTACVILSLEESGDIDSTALECLMELDQQLQAGGAQLFLARAKTTVRALLAQCDPHGLGAEQRLFWSVADAAAQAQLAPV